MNLHVISPGPLTTVQDAGRTGHAARGFRTCGAADGYAMRTANLLAGNPQAAGAAVLEMTLQGGKYQFDGDAVFALAGADMPAALDGRPVPAYTPLLARAGQVLAIGAARSGLRGYLAVVFWGIGFTFLYNFFATALRSVGNSTAALWFLLCATIINIVLDLWFVTGLGWGVEGAALATVIAQAASAAGIILYSFLKMGDLRPGVRHLKPDGRLLKRIAVVSVLTGAQQSIMNFGILMIQSLVNSFGVNVMAAFAAGVKIDAFAYAPAQDFANGFATFVAQNAGAGRADRVKRGLREAAMMSLGFCALVSAVVGIFAVPLLSIFIDPSQNDVMAVGVHYLRTEGLCYVGIGLLFLLYATYRGLERAGMSIVLTVISLGLRVALAYWLAPSWGLDAVWWAIPIGWAAADATGLMALKHSMTSLRTR